jgi:hypothetical protein
LGRGSTAGDEEHVPSPAAELRAVYIFHLRAVSEAVAVLVGALRLLVGEFYRCEPEPRQSVKLRGLRDAVVVRVPPQPQGREDGIPIAYHAVPVPAVRRLVELCEREEAVLALTGGRGWLRREVAEEFAAVVDGAVAVAV